MKDGVLLVHKVLTNQASEKELLEYETLLKDKKDFQEISEDIGQILDLTDGLELPFEVDVDAAFGKFQMMTSTIENDSQDLKDSKVIQLNSDKKGINKEIPLAQNKRNYFSISNIMKYAAMLVVGFASMYLFNNNDMDMKTNGMAIGLSSDSFNGIFKSDKASFEYRDGLEVESHLLADNSKITLTPGSELVGMADFNDKVRNVRLIKGEAFFNVAKNTDKPFIVNMNDIKVLVTGTAFDVTNNDYEIVVSVKEGSVNVTSVKNDAYDLVVGDKLVYDKKLQLFSKSKLLSKNVFNWMNKELYFESTPLNIVFDDIARYYQKEITYPSSITSCSKYTSPVFKGKTLDKVLENLSLSYDLKFVHLNDHEIAITQCKCD